jgi:hypothetical protein
MEAKNGHPARDVEIRVGFSMHTFTVKRADAGPEADPYDDDREAGVRFFDPERYELSKSLPEIIKSIERRKCFWAQHEAFLTLDRIDAADSEYRVFFSVRRVDGRTVELVVRSAYPGDPAFRPRGQTKQPIGFRVIVSKALT